MAHALKLVSFCLALLLFFGSTFAFGGVTVNAAKRGIICKIRLFRRVALAAVFQPIFGLM